MATTARVLTGLAFVAGLSACASGQGIHRDPNAITPEEVDAAQVRTAYELIERLRPLWLRSRGERSVRLETEIVVYQDQTMLGDLEVLHSIPIQLVHSVRALDAAEAGRLAGLGSRHVERAIIIVTQPGGPGG